MTVKAWLNNMLSHYEGEEVVLVSDSAQVGDDVELFSRVANHFGNKVIATGSVVSAMAEEDGARMAPTSTGHPPANSWRSYFRVKIDKII